MLVLSRKTEQKIAIGDNIFITICKVKGDVVRLGIDAPRDVSVRRVELIDRMKAEGISIIHKVPA